MILTYFTAKLLLYSSLYLLVTIIIVGIYYFYAKWKLGLPSYKYYSLKDNKEYKVLLSFSGWSLLGNASYVLRDQGIAFLLNVFYGVLLNAAMGIMIQISNVYTSLYMNLQSAFRPQIIQNSVLDKYRYSVLLNRCIFYSMTFMGIICIPMALFCKAILEFWLGKVPQYTVELVQLLMIKIVFLSVSQSIFVSLEATGKIYKAQIITSLLSGISLFIAYLILFVGIKPYWVVGAMCLMEFFLMVYRFYLANQIKCLNYREVLDFNLFPLVITLLLLLISIFMSSSIKTSLIFIFYIPIVIILYICMIAMVMDKKERQKLKTILEKKVKNDNNIIGR